LKVFAGETDFASHCIDGELSGKNGSSSVVKPFYASIIA
jgi:hypothetical protein